MRPINLIPEEERRAHGTTTRTGPLAYIIVGGLAVLLIGVVTLVLASNTISERESEVQSLEAEKTAAAAQADQLAPYVSFKQVAQQRIGAVTQLTDARFDWARVIRQLSLVLPSDVYLASISASVGTAESAASLGTNLLINGCAASQDTVAGFIVALKQIDGVTRVGLSSSSVGGTGESASACATTRNTAFNLTIAFDNAPASPNSVGIEEPVTEETEESEGEAEPEAEGTAEGAPAAATTEATG
jgi:Tfp pilus assembly protein PilN